MKNNNVNLVGVLSTPIMEIEDKGIYQFNINIERNSGNIDILPCIINEQTLKVAEEDLNTHFNNGDRVEIFGEFRSRNVFDDKGKSHVQLYVYVEKIALGICTDSNEVKLTGTICKEIKTRKTPFGRQIADLLLAVNRDNGKSDYLPCIAWNAGARMLSNYKVGDKLNVTGRIQSRIYTKPNDSTEHTAYEISIKHFDKIEE